MYFGTSVFLSGFEIGCGAWALTGGTEVFCTGFGDGAGNGCGLGFVILILLFSTRKILQVILRHMNIFVWLQHWL
jgi:hypothetical protein